VINEDLSDQTAFLSRRQVAERLAINPKTVYRLERQGRLPAIKFNCRLTRYRQADVDKLIADAEIGGAQ